MVEQRVAAVLGGLGHQPVLLAAERQSVGPGIPLRSNRSTAVATRRRVLVGFLAQRDRRRAGVPPRSRRARRASRGTRRRSRRPRSGGRPCRARSRSASSAPRSASRSSERESSKSARTSTSGSTRRCSPVTPSHGAEVDRLGAAEIGGRVLPAVRAREVDQLARGERRRQPLARLLVEHAPAAVADRRQSTKQVVHRCAPLRLPMPSDPSS